MNVDSYYTPIEVARFLVDSCRIKAPDCAVDFAAGDGQLLMAASAKWPALNCYASDIECNVVRKLKRKHPTWCVGRCDFLDGIKRVLTLERRFRRKQFPLILLNPPFSCRGGTRYSVLINGNKITCSLAGLFLAEAIPFLEPEGELIAVVPTSCLTSDKDERLWLELNKLFTCEQIQDYCHRTFKGVYPTTVVMRLSQKKSESNVSKLIRLPSTPNLGGVKVKISRGQLPMTETTERSEEGRTQVIHTTHIKEGYLDLSKTIYASRSEHMLTGPLVLLPRVGNPSSVKVGAFLSKEKIVLSDCVIALRCKNNSSALKLVSSLLKHWGILRNLYKGTCAKYVTLRRMTTALEELGCVVEPTGFQNNSENWSSVQNVLRRGGQGGI